ncbi:MAG: hypothetical protein K0Q87_3476 [Neobacillus sp.]|jgi:hypothetical protein|nr:hypothetical protein [Neobacillus sp.]
MYDLPASFVFDTLILMQEGFTEGNRDVPFPQFFASIPREMPQCYIVIVQILEGFFVVLMNVNSKKRSSQDVRQ